MKHDTVAPSGKQVNGVGGGETGGAAASRTVSTDKIVFRPISISCRDILLEYKLVLANWQAVFSTAVFFNWKRLSKGDELPDNIELPQITEVPIRW